VLFRSWVENKQFWTVFLPKRRNSQKYNIWGSYGEILENLRGKIKKSSIFVILPLSMVQEKTIPYKEYFDEFSGSGTSKYSGIISEDYNPNLRFPFSAKVFDEMRKNDATVKASLLAVMLPIKSATYSFTPASTEKRDIEIAEFCEQQFFYHFDFKKFLGEILTFLPFGFYVGEKVFEIKEGKIWYKKIAQRLQKSLVQWETKEGKDGIQQYAEKDGVWSIYSIPKEKLFYLAHEQEGDNLEGVSILRSAYKHWYYKEQIYKIQAIAAERNSLGLPVGTFENAPSQEEKAEVIEFLKNVRANEEGYILEIGGVSFRFENPNNGGQFDFEPIINHHDRQISKSVLAQFLELGVSKGAMSLSEDHSNLFFVALKAIALQICEEIQKQLVKEIVDLNFENVQWYPKLTVSDIGTQNFNDFALVLERLAGKGLITPDEMTEQHIRKMLNLPEKEEYEKPQKKEEKIVEKKVEDAPKKKDGKLSLSDENFPRPLTLAETKVDWKKLEKVLDIREEKLMKIFSTNSAVMQAKLIAFASAYVKGTESGQGFAKAVEEESKNLKKELQSEFLEIFEEGKAIGIKEVSGTDFATPPEQKRVLKENAEAIARKHANDLANEAYLTANAGIAKQAAQSVILAKISQALKNKADLQIEIATNTVASGTINQGIGTVQENFKDKIWGFQYSAILDTKTSSICRDLDGRVSQNSSLIPTPPCHQRCRSRKVSILLDQSEKPAENLPSKSTLDKLQPSFAFDDHHCCGVECGSEKKFTEFLFKMYEK
jgi:hypothetical protein